MVLDQDETVLVEYEAAFDLLYYERRGACTSSKYREAIHKALKMVEEKKVRFWLINVADSDRIYYEDQAWLLETLDLSFYENHVLEKVALVPPRELYNLMATESIVEHMLERTHFELQYFNEVASARDWLEESFREVCFYEEGLDIEYDGYHHWIYANWKGNHNFASVKRGCELISDLLTAKGCCKLLNDNRLAQGKWSDATPWLIADWFPRQEQKGLKGLAWILSLSTLHRLSSLKILDNMQSNIRVEVFNEFSRAKQWLQTL
jgi:hypothetical protein